MRVSNPSAGSVAATVGRLAADRIEPISGYWLCVDGDRDAYATDLREHLAGTQTAVVVVRTGGFDNPNSLMVDMVTLVDASRTTIEAAIEERGSGPMSLGIVMIARNELRIPQVSSPARWPEWVPEVGGREVPCHIRDITRAVDVPLDSPELDMGRVHRALYDVETAMLRRARSVGAYRPGAAATFYSLASRPRDPGGWIGFLAQAEATIDQEVSVDAYRPRGSGGASLCGRIWVQVQQGDARAVAGLGAALAEALDVDQHGHSSRDRESIFSVLARGKHLEGVDSEITLRDAVLLIANACQMVTCAAHAGEYPYFPLHLLRALTDELHSGLVRFEAVLNLLPDSESLGFVDSRRANE